MQYFFRVLLTPSCWIRNDGTSRHLSRFIQERLASGETPKVLGDYYAGLGGKTLWIGNYPYAYGTVVDGSACGMPDRKTVFMLGDAVERAMFA